MAVTRNKVQINPGDLECKKLQEFFKKRKKNAKYSKQIKKIDDLLLCFIYIGLYMLTFYLLVSLSTNSLKHIDFDPPCYLPLELSHPAQLIEAVQRSRHKNKSPKKKKTLNFKNYVKKSKFKRRDSNRLLFERGNFLETFNIIILYLI